MTDARDTGLTLNPKYDKDGLITAVASNVETGELLMLDGGMRLSGGVQRKKP